MIASHASVFCVPASVDRRYDYVLEVFRGDSADEENLVVVLDRHKLRVVDSGLHRQSLVGRIQHFNLYWLEPQLGFSFQTLGLVSDMVGDAMLPGLYARFAASSFEICQNRSGLC